MVCSPLSVGDVPTCSPFGIVVWQLSWYIDEIMIGHVVPMIAVIDPSFIFISYNIRPDRVWLMDVMFQEADFNLCCVPCTLRISILKKTSALLLGDALQLVCHVQQLLLQIKVAFFEECLRIQRPGSKIWSTSWWTGYNDIRSLPRHHTSYNLHLTYTFVLSYLILYLYLSCALSCRTC